jgi:hypothetical protein
MKRKILFGSMLLFLIIPVVASAARWEFNYTNAFTSDEINFEITNVTSGANLSFFDMLIWSPDSGGAAADWTYQVNTPPPSLAFSASSGGSIASGSGAFSMWFYNGDFFGTALDDFDFTLAWTESIGGAIQGSGTIDFVDGNVVPTPIPASAWMLLSGLAMFIGIRRRNVR